MSDEVKRHLFEPFFTTKEPGKGTGMGLASVYGTMRTHRGVVSVESALGRGTSVRLYLPLAPRAAQQLEIEREPAAARGCGHVLLVDDEPTVREMATALLRDLGYQVTGCADGHEAVAYYRDHWRGVDLVILDLVMPVLGGRDAFLAMRAINPRIRALVSSGFGLNGKAQSILDEGGLAFLGKPYRRAELARAVAAALAREASGARG